jgi:hypothetical protein
VIGNSGRVFLAGVICGGILVTAIGLAWVWWKPAREFSNPDVGGWARSPENDAKYDLCLASGKSKWLAMR